MNKTKPAVKKDKKQEKSAENSSRNVTFIKQPFPWTENFSYFTQEIKGTFFGLGSGKDHRQLHNSDYDFPDEVVLDGINVFIAITKEIHRRY